MGERPDCFEIAAESGFGPDAGHCYDCHWGSVPGSMYEMEDISTTVTLRDGRRSDVCGPVWRHLVRVGLLDPGQPRPVCANSCGG